MITTTLNRIRAHGPNSATWSLLLAGLRKKVADDEPLPFARIVEINGLDDALWCCRAEPQYDREWRMFAAWCARQVQHLMTDNRSIAALDVAERHARGQASDQELIEARAKAAAAQAEAEAWAAEAWAAGAAVAAVAARAAVAAAEAASWAALAAEAAAEAAARAGVASIEKQAAEFLRVVSETEARS